MTKEQQIIQKQDELISHYEKIIRGIVNRYGFNSDQPNAERIKKELAALKAQEQEDNDDAEFMMKL